MRVYLSVDLEGCNGIVHSSQTQPGEPGYPRALEIMHQEANAVIEGAIAAGAKSILVNDAHFDMRNLKPELLHQSAELISGWQKPYSMVSGVDDGVDAAIFVGYHSKAGTARGVLSHTYRSQVFLDVKLNGVSVGETGLNAALAGHFNIPVAMIAGDDAVCTEAKDLLGNVSCVAVKEAVSRYSAVFKPVKQVLDKLRSESCEALKNKNNWTLFKPKSPSTLSLVMFDPVMADGAELLPYVKRVADREVEITHEDYSQLFKMMLAIGAIAASRRDPYFS
ncbi:MAG: M55 family metallopeptidase [Candidatus Obscuribacterales bacterium]|nr:M55 family metallopeptidase [Candidatus Obscuribacterales bacterium]